MNKKQRKTVLMTLVAIAVCFLLPYVLDHWESRDVYVGFEGTVKGTELKFSDKSTHKGLTPMWSKILIKEQLDYFWIYLESKDGDVAFMVESYPDLTKTLQGIRRGDRLTIHAIKDSLGRGHYFPRIIFRGDEQLLDKNYMREYWRRNHFRLLRYVGCFLCLVAAFEMGYFRWANKKGAKEQSEVDKE